jgi:hypothetical protein
LSQKKSIQGSMVRYSRTAHIFAIVRDRGSGEERGGMPKLLTL